MIDLRAKRFTPVSVRLGLLAVGLCPVIYGLVLGGFWLVDLTPKWLPWQVGLIFLIALKVIYLTVFIAAATGIAVLARSSLAARGRTALG